MISSEFSFYQERFFIENLNGEMHLYDIYGRAIAEAVSRWLPTAAARVQSRVWSSGICGGQSGVGAGFLRVLRFLLPFIPPNSPSSQSPGADDVPSGPSLDSTPHYPNYMIVRSSISTSQKTLCRS
jgi:hypothetical protein